MVIECQYHGLVEASCVTFDCRTCCAVELFLVVSQDAVNLVPAICAHLLPISWPDKCWPYETKRRCCEPVARVGVAG